METSDGKIFSLSEVAKRVAIQCAQTEVECLSFPNNPFDDTLVCYVKNKDPNPDMAQNIEKVILDALPSRNSPYSIRFVRNFPRNKCGKLDQSDLLNEEIILEVSPKIPVTAKQIVALALDIQPKDISSLTVLTDLPEWDSLALVSISSAIENIINRKLTPNEIESIREVSCIEKLITNKFSKSLISSNSKNLGLDDFLSSLLDIGFGSTKINYVIASAGALKEKGITSTATLLDALLSLLESDQTLIMNGFTWEFCRSKNYHHKNTPCETGALSEFLRRLPKAVRGNHPIYSLIGYGYQASKIVEHSDATCWGQGSALFRIGHSQETKVFSIGFGEKLAGNTLAHVCEEAKLVPYRLFKTFNGLADFGEGPQPYSTRMYVRPKDSNYESNWSILEKSITFNHPGVRKWAGFMKSYSALELTNKCYEFLDENINSFLDRPMDRS